MIHNRQKQPKNRVGAGIGLILSAAMLITSLWVGAPVTALADRTTSDGFTLSDDGKTLRSYNNSNTSFVVVPNGVVTIGDNAFINKTAITNISFPSTLTTIGNNAFYGCKGLPTVSLSASVTSIATTAFSFFHHTQQYLFCL